MKPPPLAKLTRPKLFGTVARERLHALLRERLRHPGVWIAGPPGAGKTTLVAGYVEASGLTTVWYQVDGNDADAASLFHYLGIAAPCSGRRGPTLPALTAEYLPDMAGFARRYFRAFYARLPRPALLVLDNFQQASASAATESVVVCALEELPDGVGCVIVSRDAPAPAFARMLTSGALTTIGWDDLRLTEDEALAIASARGCTATSVVKASFARSAGWVAGLILLLEQSASRGAAADVPATATEAVFHYLAGAVFERLPGTTRDMLLATAMLPRMTVRTAQEVAHDERAGDELRELHERNFLVDRRGAGEPMYQLHALFREFLLDRLQRDRTAQQRRELAHRSAAALRAIGEVEAAVSLFAQAAAWPEAIEMILAMAPQLLAQGRWQTLQRCIAALPAAQLASVPWIHYWDGAAAFAVDVVNARARLTEAFEGFRRTGEVLGQMLAAATIIESYGVAYDDMTPAKPWIAELEALVSTDPVFPSIEAETQVLSSLLFAILVTAPEHPRFDDIAYRLMPLVEQQTDPNLRSPGTLALINGNCFLGRLGDAWRATSVARELVASPMLLPIRKVYVHLGIAQYAYVTADYDESCTQFAAAIALASQHGLAMLDPFLRLCDTWHHLDHGEHRAMAANVRLVEATVDPRRRADVSLLHHVLGWIALLEGDLTRARHECETALALGVEIGWKYVRPLNLFALAEVLIELGDLPAAADCVRRVRSEFSFPTNPILDFHAALADAAIAERQGLDEQCSASLRTALAIGHTHGFVSNLRWYAPIMSRLARFALEHDIEPEYVRMLIRRRGLIPDRPIERWPWRLRIYTLGRFEILREGEPVVFAGKAQHKPLELLKVLIAFGGSDVASDKLIGILWPVSPEDGGHKALEITVHRLRKLLDTDDAVRVNERHVALDPRRVWVDAWSIERQLGSLEATASNVNADLRAAERCAAGILELYRGHFLATETDQPWHFPLRTRLSGRFQRFALKLGDHWERTGESHRAAELYARVTEIDPLAETFYRREMICLATMGRRAEAIEVFRRLRQTLSVTLGIVPNGETQAVFQRLLA